LKINVYTHQYLNVPAEGDPACIFASFKACKTHRVLSKSGGLAKLPWEWEFLWEFPWVWVWDGYRNCVKFLWVL